LLDRYAMQLELYSWALGALEPEARGRTHAVIVQFAADRVIEVEVPLPQWVSDPERAENGD